jgi:hypothetical protein
MYVYIKMLTINQCQVGPSERIPEEGIVSDTDNPDSVLAYTNVCAVFQV